MGGHLAKIGPGWDVHQALPIPFMTSSKYKINKNIYWAALIR